jgi:hypothetical protein
MMPTPHNEQQNAFPISTLSLLSQKKSMLDLTERIASVVIAETISPHAPEADL